MKTVRFKNKAINIILYISITLLLLSVGVLSVDNESTLVNSNDNEGAGRVEDTQPQNLQHVFQPKKYFSIDHLIHTDRLHSTLLNSNNNDKNQPSTILNPIQNSVVESCNDTTFNFEDKSSKCGLTDCYSLWGQGQCQQINGTYQCLCNPLYYGTDCSLNYNPDHNWDRMNCHTGRFCPSSYDEGPRYCVCPPGYTGLECSVCNNDNICKNINSNYTCDTSVYINQQKSYSCFVTSAEINGDLNNSTASTAIDCDFPTGNYQSGEGTCSMNLYYKITGDPLYFACSFANCTRDILPGQIQSIYCTHSNCSCTTYCSFILNGIINQVSGWSRFDCSPNHECVFSQKVITAILPSIPLQCVSGECDDNPPIIYPVPIKHISTIYWYLSTGVGAVVIALLSGLASYIYVFQEERRKPVQQVHINCEVRFTGISCIVKEKKRLFSKKEPKTTHILDNISGICYPRQLSALMGLSGSGKTSLLDILAGRKNVGELTGQVLINGQPPTANFKRIAGYVTQEDIMIGTLTVREHLNYTAQLKLPEGMTKESKQIRVNEVLKELNLSHIADNRIGTPEKRGISGGERRRLSIASELLVDPSILFLDEPTSGLDSHSATQLITLLKELALNSNRTIIFSIHQPSAEIFDLFDNLIILHQGKPYYSGVASEALAHFRNRRSQSIGQEDERSKFIQRVNPADYIISVLNDKSLLPNWNLNYKRYHGGSSRSRTSSRVETELLRNLENDSNENTEDDDHDEIHSDHSSHHSSSSDLNNNNNNNNNNDHGNGFEDEIRPYHQHHQHHHQQDSSIIESTTLDNVSYQSDSKLSNSQLIDNIKLMNVEEYATSFWTQFFVVSHRSLLNYIRNPFLLRTTYLVHLLVGLILGYLFYKVPANLEPGCQDRFGVFFFIVSLLSFGSITSLDLFYNDRIIFIRERANGYYRTSSYFFAKVLTDLIPMRVIPPLLLGSICYYMIGLRPGFQHFLYFLVSLVLTSSTASSMCMAISTISPTFGTANMLSILLLFVFLLFDGFLLSRQSIPAYLQILVWISFMSYGLEIPVVNEFDGLFIFYNPPNTQGTYADGLEFLQSIGADPNRLLTDIYVLVGMIVGYLLLAYLFLRFLVKEYR